MRDPWWSASVIGSRMTAAGLSAALRRPFTATQPSCSLVVPYRAMCRRAPSALLAALPYIPQFPQDTAEPLAAENLRSAGTGGVTEDAGDHVRHARADGQGGLLDQRAGGGAAHRHRAGDLGVDAQVLPEPQVVLGRIG